MLSTGAFNAFLKTLEEPPPHVKFMFATTEAQKVPVTIRSRCQRYDFRLIPQVAIAARIDEILKAEKVTADESTVALVAREAAGSMRDALTLLDQLIAFGGGDLVGEDVARQLGIASRSLVEATATAILDGDAPLVLQSVGQGRQSRRRSHALHSANCCSSFGILWSFAWDKPTTPWSSWSATNSTTHERSRKRRIHWKCSACLPAFQS